MHLLIDVGNSRIKWALIKQEFDSAVSTQYGSLAELASYIKTTDVQSTTVLLAAVNQTADLTTLLDSMGFKRIIVARSLAKQAGISNSYDQPERMGVDRWLAMIAAYHKSMEVGGKTGIVVVDAGSALTIDILDAQGHHLGGYIVPGFNMAQQALFTNTEQVKRYNDQGHKNGWKDNFNKLGNNTLQCVEYGVMNQLVALVHQVKQQYSEYELVFTGGDSESLAGFFSAAKVDKNLVLKGLWQVRN
jgi:type III pantothenate kinase